MKNNKVLSWAMYDWANSAYSTTVMAGFFPLFFKQYWSAGADAVETTAKLGTALSVSGFLIAVLSPTLGALADRRGFKKILCGLFMLMGVASCFWLSMIPQGGWFAAMCAYGLGMFAFAASAVFYDALLPSIARGAEMDRASSIGFALGYLGGGILFLVNVMMYLKPAWFLIPDGVTAVKLSFASVGAWWFIFSWPLMKNVPEPAATEELAEVDLQRATWTAVHRLRRTFQDVLGDRNLLMFLLAYWLYIDGVYTVMAMAVDYGLAIGLESSHLIAALLLVQFIGFPATWIFGNVTRRWGCRAPILACIGVYAITVVLAVQMTTVVHFYALASVIGLVQGAVQSLSRSLFGNMVPERRAGEFFGLFNLIGKFASIFGPLVVAVTVTVTGNSRLGMAGLIVLFVVGGAFLWRVREPVAAPAA